jgi:DNA-binding MarR family transcriptional regulator
LSKQEVLSCPLGTIWRAADGKNTSAMNDERSIADLRDGYGNHLIQLLERTARAVHAKHHVAGLYPAQWAALRYFARVPPNERTAIQLARAQGLAIGPVTRTVRTLVAKGLLRRAGSAGRGRAQLIEVTVLGESLLSRDPLQVLSKRLEQFPPEQQQLVGSAMELIIAALQSVV